MVHSLYEADLCFHIQALVKSRFDDICDLLMSRILYAEMIPVNSKSLIKSLRKILRTICFCDTQDHSTIQNYQLTKANRVRVMVFSATFNNICFAILLEPRWLNELGSWIT